MRLLHFIQMSMIATIVGVPLVTTFKMEVINLNSEYEWILFFLKIENLKWLSRVKNIEVVNLPSLKPMDMSMLTIYPHKNT
jgi:hypothetical protein